MRGESHIEPLILAFENGSAIAKMAILGKRTLKVYLFLRFPEISWVVFISLR